MDPLSVSAAVVGLLASGAKISNTLFTTMQGVRDAPQLAISLAGEISDISTALGSLQSYVNGRAQAPEERGNLIQLEHVLMTLTGCVTTYSDLQAIMDGLNMDPAMGMFDKIKWSIQESKISLLVDRLQNHKSSITLMLNIIQCQTMRQAQESHRQLYVLVEEVLRSNQDLAQRIRTLEREGSIICQATSGQDDVSTIRQSRSSKRVSFIQDAKSALRFTFEKDLEASRVYNRAIQRYSMTSTTSTALHTTAVSVFSKLSISQISNISFYALPVYEVDLNNSYLYTFGEEGALNHSENPEGPSSTDNPKPKRSQGFHKDQQAYSRVDTGLLGLFARRRPRVQVSKPQDPVHVIHVGYQASTGKFTGLPKDWAKLINEADGSTTENQQRRAAQEYLKMKMIDRESLAEAQNRSVPQAGPKPEAAPLLLPTRPPRVSHVRALYDFVPSELGELHFEKGDVIVVLEDVYDHWWKGALRGKTGIFPTIYVGNLI